MDHIDTAIKQTPARILVLGYDNYCAVCETDIEDVCAEPQYSEFIIFPLKNKIKVQMWRKNNEGGGILQWRSFGTTDEVKQLIAPHDQTSVLSRFELVNIDHDLEFRFDEN